MISTKGKRKMRLKTMVAAMFACLALAAAFAGAAQAQWVVNGSTLSGSETVSLEKTGTANFILKGKVATTNVEIQATGITCSGTCEISNSPVDNGSTGTLKFTGISFLKPATCGLKEGATNLCFAYCIGPAGKISGG